MSSNHIVYEAPPGFMDPLRWDHLEPPEWLEPGEIWPPCPVYRIPPSGWNLAIPGGGMTIKEYDEECDRRWLAWKAKKATK
jgi:hypothetical protein